jgi:hypothetical protein
MHTNRFRSIIQWAAQNPKKLFVADGAGAILSAVLLALVLPALESFISLPTATLYWLAAFPCLFAMYDLYCLRAKPGKTGLLLKGIAAMNTGYIILSAGFLFSHRQSVTGIGYAYFLLEMAIVAALARVEYLASKKYSK